MKSKSMFALIQNILFNICVYCIETKRDVVSIMRGLQFITGFMNVQKNYYYYKLESYYI